MKVVVAVNVVVLVLLLSYSIRRDFEYQRDGPGDLRNRVVGARLTKDGKVPYFYKWKTGDSYRYLDYNNADTNVVSNITATPFFHHLMTPICEFEEKTIAHIWFILEYGALAIVVFFGVLLCNSAFQRWVIINTGVIFTYTQAWMFHVYEGQLYIFIAGLLMLITLLLLKLTRSKGNANLIIAGLLSTVLILIRPIAGIILLPFALFHKGYRAFIATIMVCAVFYTAFIFINDKEREQWKSYSQAMSEQIKIHQGLSDDSQKIDKLPNLTYLEGYNLAEQKKLSLQNPFPNYSENGNVFFIYNLFTRKHMSLGVLYGLWIISIFAVCALFVIRKEKLSDRQIILFGLTLYMITELFTPIFRHQYNTVQWLPLIFLAISIHERLWRLSFVFIFTGILLNITNTPLIPVRHTLGEFCIMFGLLLLIFGTKEGGSISRV